MTALGVVPVGMEARGYMPPSPALGLGLEYVRPIPGFSSNESQIMRGIRSAYGGAKAGLQGYGASIADVLGARDTAEDWYANAAANARQAELDGPRVSTLGQINNLGDVVDYGAGKFGEFLPYMALGGAAGLVGRGLGAVAGLRGAELARAGHLAGTAVFQPGMAGEQALAMHEDPAARVMSPEERLARSQLTGAAQAYVGAAVPNMMGGQLLTRGEAPTIGRTLGQAVGNSVAGGAGMAAMNVAGQLNKGSYDHGYDFNPGQVGEAFAGGVAGMLPVSGAHGVATHVLDRGVSLPTKVYEEGKGVLPDLPDQVKQIWSDVTKYAVEKDLDLGRAFDEHVAPALKDLGVVASAYKATFVRAGEAAKHAVQDELARREVDVPTVHDIADVETLVKKHGEEFSEDMRRTTAGLQRTISPDSPVGKALAVATSDQSVLDVLEKIANDPGSTLGAKEQMTPEKLKRLQEGFSNPAALNRYADLMMSLIDEGHPSSEQRAALEEIVTKLREGPKQVEERGKTRQVSPLEPEEVRHLYALGQEVLAAKKAGKDLLSILPKPEADTETKFSGETPRPKENVAYTNVAEAFRTAKVSDKTASEILREVQDATLRGFGPQKTARLLVNRALAKRYGIPEDKVKGGRQNTEYTAYYNALYPALQKAYAELTPESVAQGRGRQRVSPEFTQRVREHVRDLFETTSFGRQWLSREDRGATEINALADFFTGAAQGKKDHGQAALLRVLTHLHAKFTATEPPGSAKLRTRSGRPQIKEPSAVDHLIRNIIDAADIEFGGESKLGNDLSTLRWGQDDKVHTQANQILGLLKPAEGGESRTYKDVEKLLADLHEVKRVDSHRVELKTLAKQLNERWKNAEPGSSERFKLGERVRQIYKLLDENSYEGLKKGWGDQGLLPTDKKSAGTFDKLLDMLEQYDTGSGRLARPEHRKGYDGSAKHVAEDQNDIDRVQAQFEQGVNPDHEVVGTEAAGGDEEGEYRTQQEYEHAGTNAERRVPHQFVGTEQFKGGKYDPARIGAPVSRHPSSDYAVSWNPEYNESSALGAHVDATFNNGRVGRRTEVRMQDWAKEMSNTIGGTEGAHLTRAMDALLEHDKERAQNPKISDGSLRYVKARADLAARLRELLPDNPNEVGARFFANPINAHYRYHKIEPHDASNLGYGIRQIENWGGIRNTSVTDWANERSKNSEFSPEVFKDSVLHVRVKDEGGETRVVPIDIAKMVTREMRHHQAGDITGLGDKVKEDNRAQEILTAFSNVIGAILSTPEVTGIKRGNKFFTADDARTTRESSLKGGNLTLPDAKIGEHFASNLVVYRAEVGEVGQKTTYKDVAGMRPIPGKEGQYFTLGELGHVRDSDRGALVTGTSRVIDGKRVPWSPGGLEGQALETILGKGYQGLPKTTPEGFVRKESSREKRERERDNARGIANGGLEKDGKSYDVDVAALLKTMLVRNGEDPQTVIRDRHLPEDYVGMLLREAFHELKEQGYTGDLLDMASGKYDNLVPYTKTFGEKTDPVYFSDLKSAILNPAKQPLPHNFEDARNSDIMKRIMASEKAIQDARANPGKDSNASPQLERDREARVERAYRDYDKWAYTDWRDPDVAEPSTFEVSDLTRQANEALAAYRSAKEQLATLDTNSPKYTEQAKKVAEAKAALDLIKRRQDSKDKLFAGSEEGEQFSPHVNPGSHESAAKYGEAIERVNRLEKNAPLFDKSEAVGGDRTNTQRQTRDEVAPTEVTGDKPGVEDHLKQLYEKWMARAKGDPAQEKFIRDTFELPFMDEKGNLSKEFEAYLANKDNRGAFPAEPPVEAKNIPGPPVRKEARPVAKEVSGPEVFPEGLRKGYDRKSLHAPEVFEGEAAAKPEPLKKAEPSAADRVNAMKPDTLARVLNTTDETTDQSTYRFIDALSDQQLHDVAVKLIPDHEDGNRAGQMVTALSDPPSRMREWAESHLKRAGLKYDEAKDRLVSTRLSDTPFSRETPLPKDEGSKDPNDQATLKELKDRARKLLGDGFGVEIASEIKGRTDVSGAFADKLISVLDQARSRMGTLHHEIWHAVESVLKELGPNGEKVLEDVYAHMNTPLMRRWIEEKYNDEGVTGQLDKMSERAAFVFQKLSEGERYVPLVKETKTLFQRLADLVRWAADKLGFHTTTVQERSENFMDYVMRGDFARDIDNGLSVRKGLGEKNGDQLMREAAKILQPGLEALKVVFEHTSTRIAELKIPEYDKVMQLYVGDEGKGGYMGDKRRMEQAFDNDIGEIVKNLSEKELAAFKTTEEYKAFLGRVESYMRNAGVDPNEVRNFYRRLDTFDADKIMKNMDEFIADLVNHGGFKGKDKAGQARTLANQIADRGYYYDKDRALFEGRPDLRDKWAERDFGASVARIIREAVNLAERSRDRTLPDGQTYQIKNLSSLLEAGDAKADSAGKELMADTIAAYEGTLAADKLSPGLRKFMGTLLFINNVRILPTAVFSQMLEPLQLALRRGTMHGSLDALWRGIREMPRSADFFDARYTQDKWEKLANQIGSAPSRIIANVMAQMQNGMTLPGKIGHWNDKFFKLNFMDQWNRSMHIEATKHAVEFLKEHADIVRKSKDPKMVERSMRYLNELGVKEGDIKLTDDGLLQIDKADVGNDRVARAIAQYVNEAMAHPDAGSNPMWMNDPRWALLAQMKRFTFAHSKFVLDRGLKEWKLGNAFPLVPAVLAMPWMMAADGLRDTLTMTDTSYKNNWSLMDYIDHAWARSGNAGRSQFLGDVEQSIRHGGSGLEGAAGPTAELFGRFARGVHTGKWFDSLVNQVPGAPVIMPD